VADVLDVKGQNVSDVTVNVERARVDCDVKVNVTSDVPITVHLPACGRDVVFVPAGANPSNLPNTATGGPWAPEPLGAALVVGGTLLGGPALVARRRRRQSGRAG
jgi:hypothetical protein